MGSKGAAKYASSIRASLRLASRSPESGSNGEHDPSNSKDPKLIESLWGMSLNSNQTKSQKVNHSFARPLGK